MAAALWALLPLLAAIAPRPAGSAQAPLLVWSTERSLWPPLTVPGGRVLSEPELQQLLEPGLQRGPRTVLLFLQDQLSLEDFAAFGGAFEPGTGSGTGSGTGTGSGAGSGSGSAFARLQDALSSAGSSLTLPSVAGGAVAALPHTLQRLLGAPSALPLPGGALGGLRLNRSEAESHGEPTLLLVGLPHSRGSGLMGPKEALTSNDAVLGAVLRALQDERIPYTALLTARRAGAPPLPGGLPVDLGVPRRSLLAAPEAAPPPLRWPPLGDPQILFWARNLSVALGGRRRDLTPRTFGAAADVDTGGSAWDPREARLVLRYSDVFGETLNITFLLRRSWFPVSGRFWAWLEEIGVTLGGAPPARFRVRGAAAPSPLGWRCGDLGTPGPLLLPLPPLEHSQRWELRIRELQVQAFNVSGGIFGAASDCAGFFGPGAWMGLISGGLLLGGLLLGGGVLLGLRPMDRFDDPRGPPLPVPLAE